jgi:ABC-type dipeptide/oligopeptide/nickel transport system permease component
MFVARRLITSIPVFVGIVTIAFVAVRAVPADPVAMLVGEDATAAQYERLRQELGLDRPAWRQWLGYLWNTARGKMGFSLRTRRPVNQELGRYFRGTLELGLCAFVIAVAFGVPAGVWSAVRQNRAADHVLRLLTLGGVAAPVFWTALMAQWLFYGTLGWLPGIGQLSDFVQFTSPPRPITGLVTLDSLLGRNWMALRDAVMHMVLPASVLAYRVVAVIARMTRSAMLDVLHEDYIRTARSLGISERAVIFRHALRNAAPPILTILGIAFGQLLQGSILVETVFSWPGLGLYIVQGIVTLDYPVVIGVSVLISALYVLINLGVDVVYPLFDPRIRYA